MTEPTGQFVIVGAQDVMVKTDVVKTVEMVDPAGMDVIDADSEVDPAGMDVIDVVSEVVEVGSTAEVEMMEDEAAVLD